MTIGRLAPVLPASATVSADGHLIVAGCDTVELAERFGTPLLVMDRSEFESRAAGFASAVGLDHVYYAGKALLCVALCELVDSLGLGLDVCTGGELATARAAKFPPERILLHGSNKSDEELEQARAAGVGRVVVDSFDELDRVAKVGLAAKLLVRVTPGVEAHTHEYVMTGQEDQKFGFTLAEGTALEAVRRSAALEGCELTGIHAHIGSQIFELAGFDQAIARLAEFAGEVRERLRHEFSEINLGGGFGIAYEPGDDPLDPAVIAMGVANDVRGAFAERGLATPEVFVEPGRAIVGPAGITLYTVGTIKEIPGVRTYVSVDGGMSDNIRPALYGARYEAMLANRVDDAHDHLVTIAGKHCEPDTLITDVALPSQVAPGDLLCVPATGAYTYAMAWDGKAIEIVRRETDDDLLHLDRHLDGSPLEESS